MQNLGYYSAVVLKYELRFRVKNWKCSPELYTWSDLAWLSSEFWVLNMNDDDIHSPVSSGIGTETKAASKLENADFHFLLNDFIHCVVFWAKRTCIIML